MNIYFKDKIEGIQKEVNYEELTKLIRLENDYFIFSSSEKSLLTHGKEISKTLDTCFDKENKLFVSRRL